MKKRRPVFYPEFNVEEKESKVEVLEWQHMRPGQNLKIGDPSNKYYQYIYTSLNFDDHKVENLKKLLNFKGMEVVVVSILKMKDGSFFAVLERKGEVFTDKISRVYADLKNAYLKKELVV